MPAHNESPVAPLDGSDTLQEDDPRWQLVERILETPDFARSPRLSEFLRYVCRATLEGAGDRLSEQHLGEVVFGRSPNFDSTADSIVRSHALRLRQRLDQYFARVGRDERMRLLIPRGSYNVVFEAVPLYAPTADTTPDTEPSTLTQLSPVEPEIPLAAISRAHEELPVDGTSRPRSILPWSLVVALFIICICLATSLLTQSSRQPNTPWPLSVVFTRTDRTQIVLADGNYGMRRIVTQQEGSLEEYLRPDAQQQGTHASLSEREARIMNYISNSNLTSYADAIVASNLINLIHPPRDLVNVRSARDLRMRDLEEGNYIFVGSPSSNPWTSLYQNKLNFRESEGTIGGSKKFFINEHPLPGEQKTYQGLEATGSAGDDYATISLLPASSGRGSILILQGLQQEGTEAAGQFLTDEASRDQLVKALALTPKDLAKPVYFEALIRARAIAGASNSTSLVAVRRVAF